MLHLPKMVRSAEVWASSIQIVRERLQLPFPLNETYSQGFFAASFAYLKAR